MSQIASFYVLPAKLLEDLIGVATPKLTVTKSRILGLIPQSKTTREDLFWDFLTSNAKESEDFGFSGSVFCELDLFLEDRGKPMLFNLAVQEPSNRLTRARGTAIAVFDHESARKVKAMLTEVDCSADTIRRYCESGQTTWKTDELTEPLQTAVTLAIQWMDDVGPTDTGLLMIG